MNNCEELSLGRQPFSMVGLPTGRSRTKPRKRGLTMMMDWGLPVGIQKDYLELVGPYVDLANIMPDQILETLDGGIEEAAVAQADREPDGAAIDHDHAMTNGKITMLGQDVGAVLCHCGL